LKTLILIMLIPILAMAWELPPGLEQVSVDGEHVTIRDARTGIMDTYLIEDEPVINGWTLDPTDDSLVFELVADLDMYLVSELQSYDFLGDGFIELIGTDLLSNSEVLFLENSGNFNFVEVNRIESENLLYDLGDGDNDNFVEILTKYNMSLYIYEQDGLNNYADSLVWQITPLPGNFRVWPRYSDLDDDGLMEISFQNSFNFRKVDVYENTGDNEYDNNYNIPWPDVGPGQFASGDFDGDGHTEIVGGSDYGILTVFETVASDSFVMTWQGDLGHTNAYMHRYIGDTDNDGFGEWVSGSHDFSHGGFFFRVYEGDGDDQYHEIYYDSLPGNPWELGGIDAGDVDGDESPEFLFSSNANVALYKFNLMTGWHRVWLLDGLQGTVIPYLVDTDGDNINEIIIATDHVPNYTKIYRLTSTLIDHADSPHIFGMSVFPNPTNGNITIDYACSINMPLILNIYDIKGRKVYTDDIFSTEGNVIWKLISNDRKEVSSGLYFIELESLHFREVRKVTILR
jgi:hypothetical protein